ncbi:uncharacterized protein LOC129760040 [Uranotaenia lowii]|uniref:uncharacterized protein LOC129760040 n=1 Tax=Uranotaenia lowii TaxID=190385 RepID=UPI002479591E|nr:uncharacterized protein LOC129760040 [Uranotaenia lowii]
MDDDGEAGEDPPFQEDDSEEIISEEIIAPPMYLSDTEEDPSPLPQTLLSQIPFVFGNSSPASTPQVNSPFEKANELPQAAPRRRVYQPESTGPWVVYIRSKTNVDKCKKKKKYQKIGAPDPTKHGWPTSFVAQSRTVFAGPVTENPGIEIQTMEYGNGIDPDVRETAQLNSSRSSRKWEKRLGGCQCFVVFLSGSLLSGLMFALLNYIPNNRSLPVAGSGGRVAPHHLPDSGFLQIADEARVMVAGIRLCCSQARRSQ